MPLASSKQLPMMSLLHYLMLTLFHSRFLLPVPKLAHRLYNAAASSPSRPREGDSLAKTCSVFLSSYRNTRESLGEREMLWEHEPQASVSTAFSTSPKLSSKCKFSLFAPSLRQQLVLVLCFCRVIETRV